jgi:hypothetical protein
LPLVSLLGWAGCSGSSEPDAKVEVAENAPEEGDFLSGNNPTSAAGGTADQPACLGETREAEVIGLDIFLMVDISESMLEPLPGATLSSGAQTKWDAVKQSLEAFVQDPESAGIGVGLQYFPQLRPDVPFACLNNEDCGVGGPCDSSQWCVTGYRANTPQGPIAFVGPANPDCVGQECLCASDADCGANAACEGVLGFCTFAGQGLPTDPPAFCNGDAGCEGIPGAACELLGFCDGSDPTAPTSCVESLGCPPGLGACTVFLQPRCLNQTACEASVYANPALPISSAASRASEIVASLEAVEPNGRTPTGPALRGALDQAREWALQHPERQVVTVFATDGLPTECTPLGIPEIAQFAADASSGMNPVRTFVIGVFTTTDLLNGARDGLNTLARAGGSERAFVISTGGNVGDAFLAALNEIRDTAANCEFLLDADSALDFDKVNLEVGDRVGTTALANVGDAAACGADEQGWFYVRDSVGTPTQIKVCPSTCRRLTAGGVTANLQIGCATRIR